MPIRESGRRWPPLLALLLALAAPSPAAAQLGFLEAIFANVEHLELGLGAGRLLDRGTLSPRGLRTFNVEVSFGTALRGRDSTAAAPTTPPKIGIELALGYGQLTGFGSPSPQVTLTGTVEELPSLVVYAAYRPDRAVVPYLGLRSGMARLHAFRAYVGDEVLHTAEGVTYQFGGSAGLAAGSDAILLFLEGNVMYRHFASVEWSAVDDLVPPVLPRSLPFSTVGISLGVQVMLK